MPEYHVAFDLARESFNLWPLAAVGLLLGALGLVFLRIELLPTRGRSWRRRLFAGAFLGFSILLGGGVFMGHRRYASLERALADGRVSIVEGPVENFVPMPEGGHARESFSVRGIPFTYSDFVFTPAFNNTQSHGGPVRAHQYVRITYVGNEILRLEIRRQ